jgi:osmotically-inducible protein OsmY
MSTMFKMLIPALTLIAVNAIAATDPAPYVNGRPSEQETTLAQRLTKEFRTDPLYKYMNITIDLYNGLAIVHGGAPNREMVDVVTQAVRAREGVAAVYNYMTNPDELAAPATSIAVTYDYFDRMQEVGMTDNAFAIAGRVMQRLEADPSLSPFDIEVDTYLGLVILHGTVDSQLLAERVKEIARHTAGVKAVLSYVTSSIPAIPVVPAGAAPIVTREVIVQPAVNCEVFDRCR